MNIITNISKSRSVLMGMAMIAILLFHQEFVKGNHILDFFNHYGHWGVQVFIFVSGFGIWFALNKANCSLKAFYWRRLIRIMPASILGGVLALVLTCEESIVQNLLKLSGLSLWYIRTILILYFISPTLYVLFKGEKRRVWYLVLMIIFFAMYHAANATVELWWMGSWKLRQTVLWSLGSVPYFVSGMYLASSSARNSLNDYIVILVIQVCTPIIFNLTFLSTISWIEVIHPFAVLMICAATVIPVKVPLFLSRPIEWCGNHSLELYVCHEAIYAFIYKTNSCENMLPIALLASFVCAWLISMVSKRVVDKWFSRIKVG